MSDTLDREIYEWLAPHVKKAETVVGPTVTATIAQSQASLDEAQRLLDVAHQSEDARTVVNAKMQAMAALLSANANFISLADHDAPNRDAWAAKAKETADQADALSRELDALEKAHNRNEEDEDSSEEDAREAEEFGKGGPGSGEHDGHPFRGNQHSSVISAAGYHNDRGDKGYNHADHLAAAHDHEAAAKEAAARGEMTTAASHHDEAAYHYSAAAHQLQTTKGEYTNRTLAQRAEMGYLANHNAGNDARTASKAIGDYSRAVQSGNPSSNDLRVAATSALGHFNSSVADADHAASSVDSTRVAARDTTQPAVRTSSAA